MGSMIGFVGLSHLGIVSSIATASRGFDVVAYDPNPELVAALEQGRLPIHEPDLPELLHGQANRMKFTASARELADCPVVVFSRDVPTDSDNQSDLASLDKMVDVLVPELAPGTILVLLSQVRPGYTRSMAARLESILTRKDISLYYQVETLIFGRAVERAVHPERFIVGCEDPGRPLPPAYQEMLAAFGCPVLPMRYESAELAKTAINVFLVASVTATNTLVELCEQIGADWNEVAPSLRLDKRIGPHAYLSPGLGLAGGNLERDLVTLQRLGARHGTDTRFLDACVDNSRYRRDWVLRNLHHYLGNLGRPPRMPLIAVWGLAYKVDTNSTKNSQALELIQALSGVQVQVYDPQVRWAGTGQPGYVQMETLLQSCADADVLVVMTPWPEFAGADLQAVRQVMRGRVLIDPYGCLNGGQAARLGLVHCRLGSSGERRMSA